MAKLIPFPTPAPASPPPAIEHSQRIMVNLGKQRIALDVACHATVLNPPPAPVVPPPVDSAGKKARSRLSNPAPVPLFPPAVNRAGRQPRKVPKP